MNKPTLHHFTGKMYMITFEQSSGLGYKKYGIVRIFNKPQPAHSYLKRLLKAQEQFPFYTPEITYNLKTIDLDNPLTTDLFENNP